MEYYHTEDMGTISPRGMIKAANEHGKGEQAREYEECLNFMLNAGVKYIKANEGVIHYHDFDDVVGFYMAQNDYTQGLLDHVYTATVEGFDEQRAPTVVMMHNILKRLYAVKIVGWERYCELCREVMLEDKNAEAAPDTDAG